MPHGDAACHASRARARVSRGCDRSALRVILPPPPACPRACGENLTPVQFAAHELTCKNIEELCDGFGCAARFPRGLREEHRKQCLFVATQPAWNQILGITDDMQQQQIDERRRKGQLWDIRGQVERLQREVDELSRDFKDLHQVAIERDTDHSKALRTIHEIMRRKRNAPPDPSSLASRSSLRERHQNVTPLADADTKI
jgi:uncharacterized protein (UPF0335 family)